MGGTGPMMGCLGCNQDTPSWALCPPSTPYTNTTQNSHPTRAGWGFIIATMTPHFQEPAIWLRLCRASPAAMRIWLRQCRVIPGTTMAPGGRKDVDNGTPLELTRSAVRGPVRAAAVLLPYDEPPGTYIGPCIGPFIGPDIGPYI